MAYRVSYSFFPFIAHGRFGNSSRDGDIYARGRGPSSTQSVKDNDNDNNFIFRHIAANVAHMHDYIHYIHIENIENNMTMHRLHIGHCYLQKRRG